MRIRKMIMGMTSLVLHDGAMVKLLGGGPHCGWLMSRRWGRAGGRHPVRSVNNLDWQDADVDVLMLMLVLLFFCCCCTQLNAIGLYSLNGIGLNDLNVCLVWMLQFQLSKFFLQMTHRKDEASPLKRIGAQQVTVNHYFFLLDILCGH